MVTGPELHPLEHLTRRYGDVVAVDNVTFEIGRGEIAGLPGHNGAGKTTTMKMRVAGQGRRWKVGTFLRSVGPGRVRRYA